MAPTRHNFSTLDYIICGLTLVLSLSAGIYHAIKSRNLKSNREYLVGNGQFQLIPVSVSIVVTFVSGIGLLGSPAEVYAYGSQYMVFVFGAVIGNLLGLFTFVPLFYQHKFTSCYEVGLYCNVNVRNSV